MAALDDLRTALAVVPLGTATVILNGVAEQVPIIDLATALGVTRTIPTPPVVIAPAPVVLYQAKVNSHAVGGLNVRAFGSTIAKVIGVLQIGDVVDVYSDTFIITPAHTWVHVETKTLNGWVAQEFLDKIVPGAPAPVIAPVPALNKTAFNPIGVHWLNDGAPPSVNELIALAKRLYDAGRPMPTATIVNHDGAAVALSQYVRTVIARIVLTDHDPSPFIPQNEPEGIAAGRKWVDDHASWVDQVDNGVFVQLTNETGFNDFDYAFNLGIMQRCDEMGHKAAIFADSVGTPNPDQWVKRIPALRYAMAHGHIVLNHAYGSNKPQDAPVSSPVGAQWFGLRYRTLYEAVPADCRPDLVLSECGSFDALYHGTPELLADMKAFADEISADKYVRGCCWWSLGGTDADHWAFSNWYAAIAQYEAWCMSWPKQ